MSVVTVQAIRCDRCGMTIVVNWGAEEGRKLLQATRQWIQTSLPGVDEGDLCSNCQRRKEVENSINLSLEEERNE